MAQTSAEFFAGRWRGQGEVRSLLGQRLRTFTISYEGGGQRPDGDLLCEERVIYDRGAGMERSWHLSRTSETTMLGLEALQGGRMRVRDTRRGFQIRYDRLRVSAGANVSHLKVQVWREADGRVFMEGWTCALGVLPVFRSKVVLQPA